MKITSSHNPRVKAATRLRERSGRDEQGRIIIDGVREISRAVAAGVTIVELYCFDGLCQDAEHDHLLNAIGNAGADIIEVTPHVMEKLSFGHRVEGIVAIAATPDRALDQLHVPADALIAVVEGAEKPGNVGAIVRTADAVGVAAVLLADGGTDVYNPNAIRASLGAVFTVPICAATSEQVLEWLRREQFRLLAARVDATTEYTQADFRGRVAIALGSEAHGLSDRWTTDDIMPIRLPLLGSVDSLNLSATAAVLFYEALRQRKTIV